MRRAVWCVALVWLASCFLQNPRYRSSRAPGFDKTLWWRELRFDVVAHGGEVSIQPHGLTEDDRRIVLSVAGNAVDAQIADLNHDDWPELLIYVVSTDEKHRGDVVAYSTDGDKALRPIVFRGVAPDAKARTGHGGHDRFAIIDGALVQSFPILDKGQLTGKTRVVEYRLMRGSAFPVFKIDKVAEY